MDYIHLQADPEQGQAAGDTICRISTMAPRFWTPRGISVGNEKSFVVDAYHSGREDQAEGTLLYGLKEADGYSLVPHDYLYIWISMPSPFSKRTAVLKLTLPPSALAALFIYCSTETSPSLTKACWSRQFSA